MAVAALPSINAVTAAVMMLAVPVCVPRPAIAVGSPLVISPAHSAVIAVVVPVQVALASLRIAARHRPVVVSPAAMSAAIPVLIAASHIITDASAAIVSLFRRPGHRSMDRRMTILCWRPRSATTVAPPLSADCAMPDCRPAHVAGCFSGQATEAQLLAHPAPAAHRWRLGAGAGVRGSLRST